LKFQNQRADISIVTVCKFTGGGLSEKSPRAIDSGRTTECAVGSFDIWPRFLLAPPAFAA